MLRNPLYQILLTAHPLGVAPHFVSAEVGTVNATTVAVTFDANVSASDYKAGVTIKVNTVAATISSATRQTDHKIVYYVLSAAVVYGDTVTWEYAKASGNIVGETGGVALADVSAQSVTNNVAAWWLASGVNPDAVYQPKGAVSLAASYVNLFNPGTYDAAPGVAPTIGAAGWAFDGTKYLNLTGMDGATKPVTWIARFVVTDLTAGRTILGNFKAGEVNPAGFSLDLTTTTGVPRALMQNVALIGVGSNSISTGVDLVIAFTYSNTGVYTFYYNGTAAGTGTNNKTFMAGTTMQIGTSNGNNGFVGTIAALARYQTDLNATQIAAIATAMAAL